MNTELTSRSQNSVFNRISKQFDVGLYKKLHTKLTLPEYIDLVYANPCLVQSAYQRLYRMIMSHGVEKIERYNKTITRYKFFEKGDDPIYGLDENLESFVKVLRGAAGYYGTEKRIILLHGPVGSAKSTICRNLKRGLEKYTATDEGAVYTYDWVELPADLEDQSYAPCPMHDDPIKLIPLEIRKDMEKELNEILQEQIKERKKLASEKGEKYDERADDLPIRLTGELNPHCRFFMDELLNRYDGKWEEVVTKHIEVRRFVFSENRRTAIGTFQPKDEKNQDSTELTGDINYMKLGQVGKDSDPRAFNFDGEFLVSHRGVLEFIEVLKLAPEFLYDLLGATQERTVKPKKFAQVDIDVALLSHTNNPEYQRLQENERMEALRDRTVRVDIPYTLSHTEEVKILKKDYNPDKVRTHIAPHTIEIGALWAILTRLTNENEREIDLVTKAKLYDGKQVPGFTQEVVKEMRDRNSDEGMKRGISARFVQNKISNALVSQHDYVNPFMVLTEIKEGLLTYSLINNEELRQNYINCVDVAKKELGEILKHEVQKALVADDEAISRLFNNYLDNCFAYIDGVKVKNPFTGENEEPDERLMRAIEEKVDISEMAAPDFRRTIASFVGNIVRKQGRDALTWDCNAKLAKALELKLFEDTKGTIKLNMLTNVTEVIDKDLAKKIAAVKTRLIEKFGYNEQSATDVLNYVSSIFARGDMKEN